MNTGALEAAYVASLTSGASSPISVDSVTIVLTDNDPRFRVDPDKPNSYSSAHKNDWPPT